MFPETELVSGGIILPTYILQLSCPNLGQNMAYSDECFSRFTKSFQSNVEVLSSSITLLISLS